MTDQSASAPSNTLDFREVVSSQLPAVALLLGMGYSYLTPAEAMAARGNRRGQVILREVLLPKLAELNRVKYRGQELPFTPEGLQKAADALLALPFEAHTVTAQKAFDLLTLGTSVEQVIDADRKSYSVRYIDWDTPANNIWHVTEEFTVECAGSRDTRGPDIVVFCNGIPLAVIECKRPEVGIAEAISQHIRNQRPDQIPMLFAFSQLLLATAQNAAKYGTGATAAKYWSAWREENPDFKQELPELVNGPLSPAARDKVLGWHSPADRKLLQNGWRDGNRLPSAQDELIHSLLDPARLLELVRGFVVFDAGVKKVARYQQFFAVRETMRRIQERLGSGARRGGVIWHTTGSGKSLTTVMLAHAITRLPGCSRPKSCWSQTALTSMTRFATPSKTPGRRCSRPRAGRTC